MELKLTRDESRRMSQIKTKLEIPVNSQIRFKAKSDGGLRLSLMHDLTDYSYYIVITIWKKHIDYRYITTRPRYFFLAFLQYE